MAKPKRASPPAARRTGLLGKTEALLFGALTTVTRSFLHSIAEHARCHGGAAPLEHEPGRWREEDLARLLDVRPPADR